MPVSRKFSSSPSIIPSLAKLIYSIIQCVHHLSLFCNNVPPSAIKRKIAEFEEFLKPALCNDDFRQGIISDNRAYLQRVLGRFKNHYSSMIPTQLLKLVALKPKFDEYNVALNLAMKWARKNFGKKLNDSSLTEACRICADSLGNGISTRKPAVSHSANLPPTPSRKRKERPSLSPDHNPNVGKRRACGVTFGTVDLSVLRSSNVSIPHASSSSSSATKPTTAKPASKRSAVSYAPPPPTSVPAHLVKTHSPSTIDPLTVPLPVTPPSRASKSPSTSYSPSPPRASTSQFPKTNHYTSNAGLSFIPLPSSRPRQVIPSQAKPKTKVNQRDRASFVRTHPHSKNKTTDWKLPNITQRFAVIGDSNLKRISRPPTTSWECHSYPGLKLIHLITLLSKYTPCGSPPERVIFSFGINDRGLNFEKTILQRLKALFVAAKHAFPDSEICLANLNYSTKLLSTEKTTLDKINNSFLTSGFKVLPPLKRELFAVGPDNIHWLEKTANAILNNWCSCLN